MESFPALNSLGNIYEVLSGKYIESKDIKFEVDKEHHIFLIKDTQKKTFTFHTQVQ